MQCPGNRCEVEPRSASDNRNFFYESPEIYIELRFSMRNLKVGGKFCKGMYSGEENLIKAIFILDRVLMSR